MTARTTIATEDVNFSLLFLQVMFCESGAAVVIVRVVPFPLLTVGLDVTMVPLTALKTFFLKCILDRSVQSKFEIKITAIGLLFYFLKEHKKSFNK